MVSSKSSASEAKDDKFVGLNEEHKGFNNNFFDQQKKIQDEIIRLQKEQQLLLQKQPKVENKGVPEGTPKPKKSNKRNKNEISTTSNNKKDFLEDQISKRELMGKDYASKANKTAGSRDLC